MGDLVLRKVVGAIKNLAWGKLGPNWEEPYHITSVAGIGAYYLEDLEEKANHDPGMYIILEDIIINEVFYSPCLGLLYYTSCVSDIYQSIKQNLGHVCLLGPYTLGKLIPSNYCWIKKVISVLNSNLN